MRSSALGAETREAQQVLPADRKRKRTSSAQSPGEQERIAKQQSIQRLFTATQKSGNTDYQADHKAHSPKRSRVLPPDSANNRHTLDAEEMYSFPTRNKHAGTIDLTDSPPRTMQSRRLSGVKPVRNGLTPGLGAKKLVVKNLKAQPKWDPEEFYEKIWERLDDALDKIFASPDSQAGLSMEDLYRAVESACRQGKAAAVNTRLDERCRKHLESVQKLILVQKGAEDIDVLGEVICAYAVWKAQVFTIRCVFYYMDRSYLLLHSKTNLEDECLANFRKVIFEHATLKPKIIEGVCEMVSRDRRGAGHDAELLKDAISMLHDLSVYTSSFEPRFLARSQQYITIWADESMSENDLGKYTIDATNLIKREADRCDALGLDLSTRRDLVSLLQDNLIETKAAFLVEYKALSSLLYKNDSDVLSKLYKLLKRRQMTIKLKDPFSKWVEETGTTIIFDDKAQDDMVVRLLSLKRRLDDLWLTAFQRDSELGHGMRVSFEAFMNKTKKGESTWGTDNSKTGEMIAKYVDVLLRGGSKAIPSELTTVKTDAAKEEDDNDEGVDEDAEVNVQLDQVLDLFRFIHGKAVFEAFYKKDLAKRLLMGRSASADAERSMLTRLKTECGAGFTQNLEQMFKDVELGREEMSSYKDRLDIMQHKPGAVDLSVNVLSAAAWPSYPDVPVTIPADVHTAIEAFEKYYKSKHSGRKLSWKHALAHCQMKASFSKGTKEFVVSSFQAIVLLLFNGLPEGEKLSYEHIKTVSGLPEVEVKRTLQSLACAKLRPITKHPVGKDINITDEFSVNLSFNHPRYRVRINQIQLKETKQENKETHERVAEDRNFECQAAIVRIMKSRKTIGHSELVAEVITATRSRGVLAVADIKKNIDRLIEKDYMEREDGNMYSYVA